MSRALPAAPGPAYTTAAAGIETLERLRTEQPARNPSADWGCRLQSAVRWNAAINLRGRLAVGLTTGEDHNVMEGHQQKGPAAV